VALMPNRRAVLVLSGAGAKQPAGDQLVHGMRPSVTMREGHD